MAPWLEAFLGGAQPEWVLRDTPGGGEQNLVERASSERLERVPGVPQGDSWGESLRGVPPVGAARALRCKKGSHGRRIGLEGDSGHGASTAAIRQL